MAWSESGIFTATFRDKLISLAAMNIDLRVTTAKLALYGTALTPDYTADPASYSTTSETYGTNWAQGGVLVSAAASGGGSLAPSITQSSDKKSVIFDATDVSVASTTISTGAYGLYWYFDSQSPKALGWGIYFGGNPYTTSAGTFAITWSNSPVGIWVVKCVASGA